MATTPRAYPILAAWRSNNVKRLWLTMPWRGSALLGSILLLFELSLATSNTADAFVLTVRDVDKMLSSCPAVSETQSELVKGELFSFIKSSMATGSANLLTLGSTFVLSNREVIGRDAALDAYSECAKNKAIEFLERTGVRIVHDVRDFDAEFQNKSLAFLPNTFGTALTAYQPIKVARNSTTLIEFNSVSCEAEFSSPYIVYPFDSYQSAFEAPAAATFWQSVTTGSKIQLDRDSPKVVQAIEETKSTMRNPINREYASNFTAYIDGDPNDLWLWGILESRDKSCSASISVREVPRSSKPPSAQ